MPGRQQIPSFQMARGSTNERDTQTEVGSIFYNTDTSNVEVYHVDLSNNVGWRDLVMNNRVGMDLSGVDNITFSDGTSQRTAAPPFSHKQVRVTNQISVAGPWDGSNETKIPSLSGLKITPNSASEKMLLRLHLFGEWSAGSQQCSLSFKRVVGTTETWLDPRDITGIGDRKPCNAMFALTYDHSNHVSTPHSLNTSLIDEPNTTQEVTYDVYLLNASSTSTYSLNRTTHDTDSILYERGISTFSAECKG